MFALEQFFEKNKSVLYLVIVFIIAVSTLIPLFSHPYFSMHDDQHVARLYLLDQGVNQGSLYPRWVDQLGFSYGYPLFNFYPPLIYYISEIFTSIGFGYLLSLKLMLLVGTLLGSFGVFALTKKLFGSISGLVATVLFSFFSYRAISLYIRGAFAEYVGLSLIPWVLLALYNLYKTPTKKNILYAGSWMALLVLAHPFVAIPGAFFILLFVATLCFSLKKEERPHYIIKNLQSMLLALSLSAFFWLPSMIERAYTLVDTILLNELASYSIHFVYPQQLWYSPWGFGGSVEGLGDGLSFQISKPYFALFGCAVLLWVFLFKYKHNKLNNKTFTMAVFMGSMLLVSTLLMLPISMPIWNAVSYLQYLQFPWRFMAFVGLFGSIFCASSIYLIGHLIDGDELKKTRTQLLAAAGIMLLVFFVQAKYFKPQRFLNTTDAERTGFKEIAWRISSTSFEFVPKGVRTKKTSYNTTTLDISEQDIADKAFSVIYGNATINVLSKHFGYKRFSTDAGSPFTLQIHTYNFPGWAAFIDGNRARIDDNNDFKLIQLNIPSGKHIVEIKLLATPIQHIAESISLFAWIYYFSSLYLLIGRKSDSRKKSKKK